MKKRCQEEFPFRSPCARRINERKFILAPFLSMGRVYLVGAGPGAPDLLTLRAARLLEGADIVLHDALVHPDTLALARRARLIDVGKRYGKVSTEQRFIHRALIEAART